MTEAPRGRIPSLRALQALEAFARHGTVWQAADELHLTRSAVSHQLRLLDHELGFPLTKRVGTRIELTTKGRDFAAEVRRALTTITGAARRLAGSGLSGTLTISSTPGFATAWLSPRIASFAKRAPNVSLSIVTPRRLHAAENPGVDVFITFGKPAQAGLKADMLREVEFTPLCSPATSNALDGLSHPADLLRANLIHLRDHTDWVAWFTLAGLPTDLAQRGVCFSDMNLVYTAALAGDGVAIGDRFTCGAALADGRLVQPFDLAVKSRDAYYLVVREEQLDNPVVASFCGWLHEEMHKT